MVLVCLAINKMGIHFYKTKVQILTIIHSNKEATQGRVACIVGKSVSHSGRSQAKEVARLVRSRQQSGDPGIVRSRRLGEVYV